MEKESALELAEEMLEKYHRRPSGSDNEAVIYPEEELIVITTGDKREVLIISPVEKRQLIH